MSALIDPHSLFQKLQQGNALKLIDATYPPRPDSLVIGNAQIFDIDAIADLASPRPHTMPSAADFSQAVGAMGIGNDDEVIVYDQSGIAMAAARVWWMFRAFGHQKVKVLDGGLPLWRAMDLPVNTQHASPSPTHYSAALNTALIADRDDILDHLNAPELWIADARPAERFAGVLPDLRPGIPSGHIPGSINLPTLSLLDPATGMLVKDTPGIESILKANPARIISTCGSGVTACVVALAFYELGREDVAVYGGSWAEWGDPSLHLPVETGEGRKV